MTGSGDTPLARARAATRAAGPKRFYAEVTVAADGDRLAVLLDGRPVRTPGKAPLALPTRALAEAVAAEWRAQGTHIEPSSMPLTRLVNTVLDGVRRERAAVVGQIVAYAGSDLLCYRAGAPEGLAGRQRAAWDPVLAWAAGEFGLRFRLAEGVMHVAQPGDVLGRFRQLIEDEGDFALGALSSMTGLTGSALLALAVRRGRLDADAAWEAAHVDEDWQIAQWGADEEAAARRRKRKREMDAAALVLRAGPI